MYFSTAPGLAENHGNKMIRAGALAAAVSTGMAFSISGFDSFVVSPAVVSAGASTVLVLLGRVSPVVWSSVVPASGVVSAGVGSIAVIWLVVCPAVTGR